MENNPYFEVNEPAPRIISTGKRELLLGGILLILGWLLCNSVFFAGLHLGFALFAGAAICCSVLYLLSCGHKLTGYTATLLLLSLVICGSFARSDDRFVKFIMFCFLSVSTTLALCLMSGKNRRAPTGITSLLDFPFVVFRLCFGSLPAAIRGMTAAFRGSGSAGKKGGAVLLGLAIAVPLLAIVIPLLIGADAAFDALLQQLPDWDLGELVVSFLFGTPLAVFLYLRCAALHHSQKREPACKARRGIHPFTVNTVLVAVGFVSAVYLASQLAYFSGGFSGILPSGYSLAEYARRGFFELAWLCAINLLILTLAVGLVAKKTAAPLATRLLCLFIGIVTLFLAASASAKMFLYIDAYGLTRLRVLTQVIIFFLGITTIFVCIWLFVPKLPYMQAIFIAALVIGAAVAWADVDTVVARYNVNAYCSGRLETVDIRYLEELGDGAVPYIALLKEDSDPNVAASAQSILTHTYFEEAEDFRGWNYVNHTAKDYFPLPGDTAIPKQGN